MTTLIQRSFTGGEIAPALYARVDTVKYQTGLRTCRNFFVQRYGGVANRPGTQFVGEVADSSKTVRLIKFVFNSSQTYVLEFGNLYMRVIQSGAYVTETAKNITAITQATPGVLTIVGHGYSNGEEIYIAGVVGMTELNGRNFKIANKTADTFQLTYLDGTSVSTAAFTAYSSGGTAARIYTVVTPYVEADLPAIKYVQSADVITLVHPTYAPRELSRIDNDDWDLDTIAFDPEIAAPTGVAVSGSAGTVAKWVVTAVDEDTFEESLPSSEVGADSVPSTGSPRTVSWSAVTGAREYNIYRSQNGVFGFVGIAVGLSFVDTGFTPDVTDTPPIDQDVYASTNNYPSAVGYIQQRLGFANTNTKPEEVRLSRTGRFKNYTVSSPIQDDDAIRFTMAGRQVNQVKHLVDLGELVIFTSGGEWQIGGDVSGIITPTEINPKQHSYNGSNDLAPIIISGNALYVQARGSVVRDLGFDYQIDGYRGNDLTVFSYHLVDGYSLTDWDYQQIPHSIVWCVRDDGVLLGLTYVREHQVLAWHRHDFEGGVVENVCVVPEGSEDFVYFVVKRTIDGRTTRYVERMVSRRVDDVKDSIFMDSTLSYDGRNVGVTTMTLSGGSGDWDYTQTLTLTASASYFNASMVGNQIHFRNAAGTTLLRFDITGYTSATVVTGKPVKDVPAALRSTATALWAMAVDVVSGLWHLEGESVSVLGDGFVVANPNNDAYDVLTVTDGELELDKQYAVIHVGLPYTSDLWTLDVDTADGESISNKKKRANVVTLQVEESRGIFVGADDPDLADDGDFLSGLTELKIRSDEGYDDPIDLETGPVDVIIRPEWNSNGRIFVRQTDPVPLAIGAIAMDGHFPFRG